MSEGNRIIDYCNTDLVIISPEDPTPLVDALKLSKLHPLYVPAKGDDGQWHVSFETDEIYFEPATNIEAILSVLETVLERLLRGWQGQGSPKADALWKACALREFNIGYDCGEEPWAFNNGLTSQILGRMAALDINLRITLYPICSGFRK